MDQKTVSIIVPILIVLPLVYLRLNRMMKPQRLKLGLLWLRPVIMLAAAAALLAASPPRPSDLSWFAAAAILGAGGGWYWGKLTRITVHPEDGTLISTGSQAGMIVLVLLLVLRLGMRTAMAMEAVALHLDVTLLTDVFIVLVALLFSMRGLEIFLRGRRMMHRDRLP